ncbi:MAG: hypothetical protein A3H98_02230 [Bacteroidetes bacterium RIFCSPLOWO2_02_FULL_36_8]|nr:MAG: hypothetical protein A3H98_02230 [Bacteroidetes bacterium RIFCSPLOWO2_02_FULL_36_8]OFY69191.1 MAG: hypothetical protein A3G23_06490 [Bacteroidetes bacterium RIFCSPLOWO2_12_FULL_37_12]
MEFPEITDREKVLKKIRAALIQKNPKPAPPVNTTVDVFASSTEPLDIRFAQALLAVKGHFVFCVNETEFLQHLAGLIEQNQWSSVFCWETMLQVTLDKFGIRYFPDDKQLIKVEAGVTLCEALIARTGSVLVSSKQSAGRRLTIFPPVHIVVAYINQLVEDIDDALNLMKEKYKQQFPSMLSIVTGPSRTADIEKTLVLGAHGPKELYVYLIDERRG